MAQRHAAPAHTINLRHDVRLAMEYGNVGSHASRDRLAAVAVAVTGEARSLADIYGSLLANVIHPLRADVFMHIGLEWHTVAWARPQVAGGLRATRQVSRASIATALEAINPVNLTIAEGLPLFARWRLVMASIMAREATLSVRGPRSHYLWIIRVRPDLMFQCSITFDFLRAVGQSALVQWDYIAILSRPVAEVAMTRVDTFVCHLRVELCVPSALVTLLNASFFTMSDALVWIMRLDICAGAPTHNRSYCTSTEQLKAVGLPAVTKLEHLNASAITRRPACRTTKLQGPRGQNTIDGWVAYHSRDVSGCWVHLGAERTSAGSGSPQACLNGTNTCLKLRKWAARSSCSDADAIRNFDERWAAAHSRRQPQHHRAAPSTQAHIVIDGGTVATLLAGLLLISSLFCGSLLWRQAERR